MTARARPSDTTPTPGAERLLAPDLARGVMLLLIALAHSRMLHGGGIVLTAPAGGGPLDVAVQAVLTSLVDGRAAPLFGLLFGYGLVQTTRRRSAAGEDPAGARRLLRRRGAWLIVFGAAHVVLLYSGDIIGSYGVIAVVLAGAVTWSARRLWWVAAVALACGTVAYVATQALGGLGAGGAPAEVSLLDGALLRASVLPLLPVFALTAVAPVLVGVWAAQRRLLERPERHRALLRRVALTGLPVAVLGALPVTLQAVDAWSPSSTSLEVAGLVLFAVTGVAGGFGYAAVIALVAERIGRRRGRVVEALVACGRRSMTFYIAQSPVWFVMTEPALLDLGGEMSAATAAGVAVVIWVVTVVLADLLRRAGRRGPAEALIRRLTYGRSPAGHGDPAARPWLTSR